MLYQVELLPPQRPIIATAAGLIHAGSSAVWETFPASAESAVQRAGGLRLRAARFAHRAALRMTKVANALPSHPHVLEAHGAQARGIEQVLGVDDDWTLYQMANLGEIEGAEFGPAGCEDQGIDSLSHAVG